MIPRGSLMSRIPTLQRPKNIQRSINWKKYVGIINDFAYQEGNYKHER